MIPHFGRYRLETTVEAIIIKRADIVRSLKDKFISKYRLCLHQMGYIEYPKLIQQLLKVSINQK